MSVQQSNQRMADALRSPEGRALAQEFRSQVVAVQHVPTGQTVSPSVTPNVRQESYQGWQRGRTLDEAKAIRPPPAQQTQAAQTQAVAPQPAPQKSAAQTAEQLRTPQTQQQQQTPQRQAGREPGR